MKHPILLPRRHPLSTAIFQHYHKLNRHQGAHISHGAVIQAGFHIERGRQLIRELIKDCVLCKKLRGSAGSQLMADLPPARLEETPPFSVVGVDVFGPFHATRDLKPAERLLLVKSGLSSSFVSHPELSISSPLKEWMSPVSETHSQDSLPSGADAERSFQIKEATSPAQNNNSKR